MYISTPFLLIIVQLLLVLTGAILLLYLHSTRIKKQLKKTLKKQKMPIKAAPSTPLSAEKAEDELNISAIDISAIDTKSSDTTTLTSSKTTNITLEKQESDGSKKGTDELNQLLSLSKSQSQVITSLKKALHQKGDRDTQINGLEENIERIESLMRESESCVKLMEGELRSANMEIDSLEKQIKAKNHQEMTKNTDKQIEEMQTLINQFAQDSKEMMNCINTLENENGALKLQLQSGTGIKSSKTKGDTSTL